ncbi:uncharacterized protein FIBRA_00112 [Fibroporia radiculosa]|uniref:VHS domain-containing protein n=1 Tax=Fibroporia radiculosa TaxID=599839 RepID=J7SCG8_9APHY|nr:uncharacterized protein FIBRA_00112 [Fibroporia radiculosa]CCL98118.1 predicted protein [Fibroporia radiculosa]
MSMQLAKSVYGAFNREKPHSSITEWVEILTSSSYEDEAYDGIPDPTEASRAIRKKLKHGNAHQQYRALVILKALVENGGHNFQTTFADHQLTDALKMLATESTSDPKVKKKVVIVLNSWHLQFKDDPSMSLVANLYKVCGVAGIQRVPPKQPSIGYGADLEEERERAREREREKEAEREEREAERRRKEQDKLKAKEEKVRRKREEEEKRKAASRGSGKVNGKVKRKPFDFEQALAKLVNTEHDSIQTNTRVQECLEKAKLSRKQIVRYIQLVENEEMIGTLIEANDRIIASIESYDTLARPNISEQDVKHVQDGLAALHIQDSELGKLQEKQRAAVQRSIGRSTSYRGKDRDESGTAGQSSVYPDLQDLSFGSLGHEQGNLPPPLRPSTRRTSSDEDDDYGRGTLSDYSDYESSDEGTHNRASTSTARAYAGVSEDEEDARRDPKHGLLVDTEDPFADPFMDP